MDENCKRWPNIYIPVTQISYMCALQINHPELILMVARRIRQWSEVLNSFLTSLLSQIIRKVVTIQPTLCVISGWLVRLRRVN